MTKKQYWKSLKLHDGKIVSEYDDSEWTIGEWRTVPKPKRECEGLNCCEYIQDAMGYVSMDVLAEVEIKGKKIIGNDKLTVEKMRIVRAWKWEKKDSVELAIFAAELVLPVFEAEYPDDKRPHNAIQAAKDWLEKPLKSTEEEVDAAAWAAARAAETAADAAWSAARVADAAEAAWAAEAAEAAWAAARAAWVAARAARVAETAADAARAAAWAAEAARAARAAARAACTAARTALVVMAAEDVHPNTKLKIHDWIIGHIPELAEIHREAQE